MTFIFSKIQNSNVSEQGNVMTAKIMLIVQRAELVNRENRNDSGIMF